MFKLSSPVLREHGLALVLFGLLSIGLTWPLVRDFTWLAVGRGSPDVHESMWIQWHYKEALLGRQPLLNANYLFYPFGIPMLLAGDGPLVVVPTLPFWRWGPVAAYNGGMLLSVCLTGYCMYLLGRGLGFTPSVAFLTGVMVQTAQMALGGLNEHNQTAFIGFLPLALWAAARALDPKRSWVWAAGVGAVLLLTSLYSGYQLVYAGLGVGGVFLMRWSGTPRAEMWGLLRRAGLMVLWGILLVGPLLAYILSLASAPEFRTDVNVTGMAKLYGPDIVQFFLPSFFHGVLGSLFLMPNPDPYGYPLSRIPWLNATADWVGINIETAVTLSWTGIVLCLVALRAGDRRARVWGLFTLVFIILALGPMLRAFGHTTFTDLNQPIPLPFAFFIRLPGLEFMRVSSRMMMMGAVGFAVVAGWGLTWLQQRFPQRRLWLTGLVVGLVLLESWPRPWPQAPMPTGSPFYQQLSQDTEMYGVLDLPIGLTDELITGGWPRYAGLYQMYQLVHGKPIAWGYLSHVYVRHPMPILRRLADRGRFDMVPLRVNGEPAAPYANGQAELALAGYRYVILHKTLSGNPGGAQEDLQAQQFIATLFESGTPPVWEDRLIRVYQLPRSENLAPLTPALKSWGTWRYGPGEVYYTRSPAIFQLDSPRAQAGELRLMPVVAHDPTAKDGVGVKGILDVTIDGSLVTSVAIEGGKEAVIPLQLRAGTQVVNVSLRAGNFRTTDFGGRDSTVLSYGIAWLDLRMAP